MAPIAEFSSQEGHYAAEVGSDNRQPQQPQQQQQWKRETDYFPPRLPQMIVDSEFPPRLPQMLPKQTNTMNIPYHQRSTTPSLSQYSMAPSAQYNNLPASLPMITPPPYASPPSKQQDSYFQYQNEYQNQYQAQPQNRPASQYQSPADSYTDRRSSTASTEQWEANKNGQICSPTPPSSVEVSPVTMFTHPVPTPMMSRPRLSMSPPIAPNSSSKCGYPAPANAAPSIPKRSSAPSSGQPHYNIHLQYHQQRPNLCPSTTMPGTIGLALPPAVNSVLRPQQQQQPQTQKRTPTPSRPSATSPLYRLSSELVSRIAGHLDPLSAVSLSRTSRAMYRHIVRQTYRQRLGFVLRVEIKTPAKEKVLFCYACGWAHGVTSFARCAPLAVRVGRFRPGLEAQCLDRFPPVSEWVWGGFEPGAGEDWRIVDIKHPPEPDDQSKKRGPANPNQAAKREFWQRSDVHFAPPPGFSPTRQRRRYWPGAGGEKPLETRELFLRRFCMDCGAKAGVHAIKDKLTLQGTTKASRSSKGRGPPHAQEEAVVSKADRWICGCRKVHEFSAAADTTCRDCGLLCSYTNPPRLVEDEEWD